MKKNETYTAYICGRIEAQLEGYADSAQIPRRVLTGNVGAFLLSASGRKQMGVTDTMPPLPRTSTNGDKTTSTMEMAKRPYSRASKLHWTQTPEGKEKMRQRMKKYWKEGRFKDKT